MALRRRQLLHLLGGAAASPLFACAGDEESEVSAPTPEPDADKPWWLRGNFSPVEEVEAFDLEVVGALPAALDGVYLRNGPNPFGGASDHWFLGDGMVHGVRLSAGKAEWYRARYVRTEILGRLEDDTPGPPGLAENPSNTAVVDHAGRVLCLCEVGLPYEVTRDELATVGAYDFAGKLAGPMTAHPKVDPATGELVFIGYGLITPTVDVHFVGSEGELTRSERIELPQPIMMHDFQLTATHVVLMDLPIVFDIELAIAGQALPFRWAVDNGARIGVMPRAGAASDVRWFDIDPCYVFHTLNAFHDPANAARVSLDVVRYSEMWVEGIDDFDHEGSVWRYTLDLDRGITTLEQLDDRVVEMPRIDPRRQGVPNRFAYAMAAGPPSGDGGRTAIVKYDLEAKLAAAHPLPEGLFTDEPVFVPGAANAGEDEGWLLAYAYDAAAGVSELHVLDAQDIESPAVARVRLPQRVPFGFHGAWSAG